MSKFSGKCDVYDTIVSIHNFTDFSKLKLYHKGKLLNIETSKDLIPYYPYLLVSYGVSSGNLTGYLSDKSYVDIAYDESVQLLFDIILREYKKYKRAKKEFIPEEVAPNIYSRDKNLTLEVCKRIKANPKTKDDTGLVIYYKFYRQLKELLCSEMVDNGYTVEQAQAWVWNNIKTW